MFRLSLNFLGKYPFCPSNRGGGMRLVSDSIPTNRFLEFLQEDHHPQAVSTEYTKWFSEISSWHHPPTTVSTGSTKWISAYTSRHHLFCHFFVTHDCNLHKFLRRRELKLPNKIPDQATIFQDYFRLTNKLTVSVAQNSWGFFSSKWSYSSLFACLFQPFS